MMRMNHVLFYKVIAAILLFSCNEIHYDKNYNKGGLMSVPTKVKEGEKYLSELIFSMEECNNNLQNAKFYRKGKKFYVKLLEPETEYFLLFDLNKKIHQGYSVNIRTVTGDEPVFNINIVVENIISVKNSNVYVFRIKRVFCHDNYRYDIVFFVEKCEGVIGSYISSIDENNKEYIMYPEGNYLKNVLDYSDKKFTTIK